MGAKVLNAKFLMKAPLAEKVTKRYGKLSQKLSDFLFMFGHYEKKCHSSGELPHTGSINNQPSVQLSNQIPKTSRKNLRYILLFFQRNLTLTSSASPEPVTSDPSTMSHLWDSLSSTVKDPLSKCSHDYLCKVAEIMGKSELCAMCDPRNL